MINVDNVIKVMDLGLARIKDEARLTKTSTTAGTLSVPQRARPLPRKHPRRGAFQSRCYDKSQVKYVKRFPFSLFKAPFYLQSFYSLLFVVLQQVTIRIFKVVLTI